MIEELPCLSLEFKEQADGSLFAEVVSPSGRKLWLSTENQETTVGFDLHHWHFGTSWDPDVEDDTRAAAEYLRKLICGDYSVAVWTRNGTFIQSETAEKGVDPAGVPRSVLGRWWLKGCTVELRSW